MAFKSPFTSEHDTPAEAYWRSLTQPQRDAVSADWLRDQQGFTSSIEYAYALTLREVVAAESGVQS